MLLFDRVETANKMLVTLLFGHIGTSLANTMATWIPKYAKQFNMQDSDVKIIMCQSLVSNAVPAILSTIVDKHCQSKPEAYQIVEIETQRLTDKISKIIHEEANRIETLVQNSEY